MEKRELDAVKASTAAGVREAIADPETWKLGIAAMQVALANAAQRESGKWVIGWVKWMLKKTALLVGIAAVLYYTGGPAAVITWFKTK